MTVLNSVSDFHSLVFFFPTFSFFIHTFSNIDIILIADFESVTPACNAMRITKMLIFMETTPDRAVENIKLWGRGAKKIQM